MALECDSPLCLCITTFHSKECSLLTQFTALYITMTSFSPMYWPSTSHLCIKEHTE